MPSLLSRRALEIDRQFVIRQIEEAEDDDWGTVRHMWRSRLADIEAQIAALEEVPVLASVALVFDGVPVIGASDIQLGFAADALLGYQNIVATTFASQIAPLLPDRGPLPGFDRSQLFIQDLARGSLGFILEELPNPQRELFPTTLKEAVEASTDLIATLSSPGLDEFGAAIAATQSRVLAAVHQFARVLEDAHASARIVADEHEVALSQEDVIRLAERLVEQTVDVGNEFMAGRLLGMLPDVQRFEFAVDAREGVPIRGSVSDDLAYKYMNDAVFRNRALGEVVRALIRHRQTQRGGRQVSQQWFLESIEFFE